ncbi:unnamed protein product [Rhizophagus irregularis]|nr:unnamed protein product [Rhizophagus irregularis]
MDQVTSSDGCYLLSWPDVKRNNNNNFKGIIPSWYQNLVNNYVLSNNLRLIHPLNDVISDINHTHKSPLIVPAVSSPKSQWSIHWNNVQKQVIFGLVACNGCLLHSYYPHDARPTCVIAIRTQKLLVFNIFKKSSTDHKSLLEFYNRQPFVVATKPFHTLRHIAFENFIKLDKSPLKTSTHYPLNATYASTDVFYSKSVFNHIDNALICHHTIKSELKSCAKKLQREQI